MDAILAVTYRCNSRCIMCNTWQHPSKRDAEIQPRDLENLPALVRLNITGGEPFLRDDLSEILTAVKKKARRCVISSNGFLTGRILAVMKEHRDVGIRISFDGIGETHDRVRGVSKAHDRALSTLKGLKQIGIRDIGIAVTISDQNAGDLVPLFELARREGVELATAVLHNAYYFHKMDNHIVDTQFVENQVRRLIREFLKSTRPKNWFRAYFTKGLLDHMNGRPRELTCTMATDAFFIDPFGDVRPCNVMDRPFGNIRTQSFERIWDSPQAAQAREQVAACRQNCWMIGSVGHLMRHRFWVPLLWILKNKWRNRGCAQVCAMPHLH